jgi:phage gpG-like protein
MANDELNEYVRLLERLNRTYKNFPNKAATLAINFIKERFNAQNWVDSRTEPWKPRKYNKGSKRRQGRKVLIDKARLLRSWRKENVTDESAVVATDVPYAKIHNEGGRYRGNVTVKAHTRRRGRRSGRTGRNQTGNVQVKSHTRKMRWNMPRRQFAGASAILDKRIERMMTSDINKVLNTL